MIHTLITALKEAIFSYNYRTFSKINTNSNPTGHCITPQNIVYNLAESNVKLKALLQRNPLNLICIHLGNFQESQGFWRPASPDPPLTVQATLFPHWRGWISPWIKNLWWHPLCMGCWSPSYVLPLSLFIASKLGKKVTSLTWWWKVKPPMILKQIGEWIIYPMEFSIWVRRFLGRSLKVPTGFSKAIYLSICHLIQRNEQIWNINF